ncbi:MAG: hypothetical protein NTY02_19720, partial [Acidobacteria bacterium]|nr:hypothetical protein [Acidobacteriota bacterium]
MKILFVMETPEYLRFFDSTFSYLLDHGHALVLAVTEDKQKKPVRLERFEEGHPSLTIAGVAPPHEGIWGEIAKGLRGTVDYVRFLHPDYRHAPALRNRMKRKVLPVAFQPLGLVTSWPEPVVASALRFLSACETAVPVSPGIRDFVAGHQPDAVWVTPLVDAASAEVDFVKAARSLGIPAGVCVASWDNLTNKGLLRTQLDRVTVWNERQRDEAVRYHGIAADKVVATGAQPFDRWFERGPSTDRQSFCRMVGLPADRPFIVFTGSSGFISEGQAEVAFVRRWLAALRGAPDSRIAHLGVVVRPHPYNGAAWEGQDLSGFGPTTVWPRGRYNP